MENLFNLDIERGILSAILFDGILIEKVKNILNKNDFYNPKHQHIYEAMISLWEKDYPIDETLLKEELEKENKFDEQTMMELITTAPISMIEVYAKEIKEYSIKRKILHFSNIIKQNINDDNLESFEIIENLKQELENLNKNSFEKFNFVDFGDVENKEIEFILKDFLPLPKKAVSLLSSKGGSGKSWLVLQLALRYINQNPNKKVFAWLSEDPTFATKKRAEKILNEILIKYKNINDPIYKNFKYLGSETRPFHFIQYDFKNKKINNLFYKLKNQLKDFDFIILDPLIAFFGGDENNNSQAREFMNLLTEWADKENKTILVVHHNNKSITGGIRGASAFVDAVRLQYSLKMYNDDEKEEKTLPAGYRKITIEKDNWGVERILNTKEKEIQIFGNKLKINVIENNSTNNDNPLKGFFNDKQ